jgi:CSLREA domain-containing protein
MRGLGVIVPLVLWGWARAHGAVFTVDTQADDDHGYPAGSCPPPCTLRDAIRAANSSPGEDTIAFDISGCQEACTIAPTAPLPALTDDAGTLIDGYTQPGSSRNSLTLADNAILRIHLGGAGTPSQTSGLDLEADQNTIRGLSITEFSYAGILVGAGSGNTITGNFIGVEPIPLPWKGNCLGIRIMPTVNPALPPGEIPRPPAGTVIGGTDPGSRNVISGNGVSAMCGWTGGAGIDMTFGISGSIVEGNFIGVDASGAGAIANFHGVMLVGGDSANRIGGVVPGAGNVISGNENVGVGLSFYCTNNTIQGNFIGTTADGRDPLPNHMGIWTYFSEGNLIGGTTLRTGNVIAYNPGEGVLVGAAPTDTVSTHETIVGNSIHDNGILGIDLGRQGLQFNDWQDRDHGANDLQNFPVLTSAVVREGSTTVTGKINSAPSSAFAVDLYANDHPEHCLQGKPGAPCFGEGKRYLGRTTVVTGPLGNGNFNFLIPADLGGEFLAATATNAAGSTSEFSMDLAVGQLR